MPLFTNLFCGIKHFQEGLQFYLIAPPPPFLLKKVGEGLNIMAYFTRDVHLPFNFHEFVTLGASPGPTICLWLVPPTTQFICH